MKHTPMISRNDHPALSSVKAPENRSARRRSDQSPINDRLSRNDRTDIRPNTAYSIDQESVALLDLKDVASISDKIDRLGQTEVFGMAYQAPNRENTSALLAS